MEILSRLNGDGGPNTDDAMFSKRHIGPVACASCEKNVINMHGIKADHHVWNKLPFRETNDRIARYGQGFSKILSHMIPSEFQPHGNSPGRNGLARGHNLHHASDDDTYLDGRMRAPENGTVRFAEDARSVDRSFNGAVYNNSGRKTFNNDSAIGGENFGGATTNPATSDIDIAAHEAGYGSSTFVKTPAKNRKVPQSSVNNTVFPSLNTDRK